MSAPANSDNLKGRNPGARSVAKTVFPFIWGQRKWIFISFIFAVGVAIIQIKTSELVKNFMDNGILAKDTKATWQLSVLLVFWFFFEGVFDFMHKFAIRIGAERLVQNLRNKVFEKFLIFSRPQAMHFSSAKAVTNMSVDISTVSWAIIHCTNLIREPLVIIGLFAYLFYLSPQLTFVCIFVIPALGGVGFLLGKSARRNQRRIQLGQEKVMNVTIEAVQGLETAQILGQPHKILSGFKDRTRELYSVFLRLARAEELGSPLTKWIGSFFGASLIGYGGFLVSKGLITAGELTAYIVTAGRIQGPLKMLNDINVKFNQAAAAAERLSQTLDQELDSVSRAHLSLIHSPPAKTPLSENLSPKVIEVRNLFFNYHNSGEPNPKAALRNLSLKLEPNSRTAFVGKSGSGKSTLTRLILRLMDPTQGSILFDGKDIREWPLGEFRKYFSFVPQETFLFSESLRSNFDFIHEPKNDEEIWEALRKAHALDFVKQFSNGLDEPLGDRAQFISGGEKQRLAIARAFYKKAPIVILDEPTSHLDSITEQLISESLTELFKNRTGIIIAHRLSTVKDCNNIVVLDRGEIIESGSPESLLSLQKGHFLNLWNHQNLSRNENS
jgi:ABC-type multidrug transport system fused ATPase/permease subunit